MLDNSCSKKHVFTRTSEILWSYRGVFWRGARELLMKRSSLAIVSGSRRPHRPWNSREGPEKTKIQFKIRSSPSDSLGDPPSGAKALKHSSTQVEIHPRSFPSDSLGGFCILKYIVIWAPPAYGASESPRRVYPFNRV